MQSVAERFDVGKFFEEWAICGRANWSRGIKN